MENDVFHLDTKLFALEAFKRMLEFIGINVTRF